MRNSLIRSLGVTVLVLIVIWALFVQRQSIFYVLTILIPLSFVAKNLVLLHKSQPVYQFMLLVYWMSIADFLAYMYVMDIIYSNVELQNSTAHLPEAYITIRVLIIPLVIIGLIGAIPTGLRFLKSRKQ